MATLRELLTQGRDTQGQEMEITWRQPEATKNNFVLHGEGADTPLATLRWQKLLGTLATAETPDATWTFKRTGFLHPRVTARIAGTDDDRAVFDAGWHGGGTLTIVGGATFTWQAANFWRTQWGWRGATDTELLHFASKQGLLRQEGAVTITPDALRLPELGLLVTLGWYLLVLTAHDSTAAAGAATAATT